MKKSYLSPIAGVVLALATMSAAAGPILVKEWAGNSGAANELQDVKNAIIEYNAAKDPDLPALGTALVIQDPPATYAPNDEKVIEWTAPSTFDYYYIMSKWGIGQATFDHALHYVLPGEKVTYNPGGDTAPNGLSHVSIWGGRRQPGTNVPDGGFSLALLGLGAFGLSRLRL